MSGFFGKLLRSPLERLERVLRETGKEEKLRYLLERFGDKLDVHSLVFKGGFSSLQLCALHGHAACVHYLITEQHVNVHHVNPLDNSTALHVAACGGSLQVVQALVELGGANINCVTEMGFTPLHYAVLGGKTEVYVYLISTGLVDVSFRNSDGVTPLLLAARAGQHKACQYLIEYAAVSIEECDTNGCTALHYACAGGNQVLVMYLIGSGANACAKDNKGRLPVDLSKDNSISALFSAGGVGVGSSLLPGMSCKSRGSSPKTSNASDRDTTTDSGRRYKVIDSVYGKLEAVCKSGRVSELEKIIARRPDLDELVFAGGWNCLHLCAQNGHVSCIELLANKAKMDVDRENGQNGVTALHILCRYNYLPAIKVLLNKGKTKVNVNCRTFKGKVPLHFAVMHGDKATCAYLLANKADTYAQDISGRTPLMYAVRRRDVQVIELLLQYNADVNVRDVKDRTAMQWARSRGYADVVALLSRQVSAPVSATVSANAQLKEPAPSVLDFMLSPVRSKTLPDARVNQSGTSPESSGDDDFSDDDFDGWQNVHGTDDDDAVPGFEDDASEESFGGRQHTSSLHRKAATQDFV